MSNLRRALRSDLLHRSILSVLFAASPSAPAYAQDQPQGAATDSSEIVVTARRRDETLIAVPVTVTAVTGAQLQARGINSLDGLSRTIPQLITSDATGSPQGGAISLRGIAAGDGLAFADQAVAFNIDGIQVARSTPRRFTAMDINEIQVLKGPQALYFGKNSPGGVIVIRSADPTKTLSAGASAEYEFVADEMRFQGYVAGPINDGLGFRVAAAYSRMKGYTDNIATPGTIYEPASRRSPYSRDFGIRGTLKFDNGGPLTARAKFNYGRVRSDGPYSGVQLIACPLGVPQLGGPDDCRLNRKAVRASIGPVFGQGGTNTLTGAPIAPLPNMGNDGKSYFVQTQYLAGLEMTYALSDTLSLASNTGFYRTSAAGADNATLTDSSRPASILASAVGLQIREFSEELRLTSNFHGIFNFMLGGYVQDQKAHFATSAGVNAINPSPLFPPITFYQKGVTYSGFGSISVKPIETLEISGGARYSHERKQFFAYRLGSGSIGGVAYSPGTQVPVVNPDRSFHNVSPEITITWRPSNRLTLFGGWKRGFISGGFNTTGLGTGVAIIPDRGYDQEIVEGFEGGIKASTMGGRLRFNLSAFDYKVKDLQVTSTVNLNGITTQIANNAARARSRGVEADASFDTPINGLSLNGALSYNRARYSDYKASACYVGQTIALGCNSTLVSGLFRNQDLSGHPLVRAPEWGAALGGRYRAEIGGGNELLLSANANYSSSFYADPLESPESLQSSYWLFDAAATLKLKNGIEVALIGRNLSNKYYFTRAVDTPLTGSGTGSATGLRADTAAIIGRPRELTLRLAVKF